MTEEKPDRKRRSLRFVVLVALITLATILGLAINDNLKIIGKARQSLLAPVAMYRGTLVEQLRRERGRRSNAPKVPVRLYDLLAGLSVRYGNRSYLQQLISLVEASPDLQQALPNRLSTWKDSKKRWHVRWTRDDMKWNKTKLPKKLGDESSKVG